MCARWLLPFGLPATSAFLTYKRLTPGWFRRIVRYGQKDATNFCRAMHDRLFLKKPRIIWLTGQQCIVKEEVIIVARSVKIDFSIQKSHGHRRIFNVGFGKTTNDHSIYFNFFALELYNTCAWYQT